MFKPRFANKSMGRLAVPAVAATALTGTYLYYRKPSNNANQGGQAARSRKKRDEEGLGAAGIGQNTTSGGHESGQVGSGVQTGTGDVERSVKTTAESRDKLPAGGVGGGVGAGGANVRAVEMSGGKSKKNDVTDNLKGMFRPGDSTKPHLFESRDTAGEGQASSQPPSSGSTPGRSNSNEKDITGFQDADKKVTSQSYPTSTRDYQGNSSTNETTGTGISQRLQGVFGQGGKTSSEPGETQKKYHDTKIHSNHAETPTKRDLPPSAIGASGK